MTTENERLTVDRGLTVAANGAGSPLFLWDQGWLGKLTDDIPVDHLLPVLLALPSIGLSQHRQCINSGLGQVSALVDYAAAAATMIFLNRRDLKGWNPCLFAVGMSVVRWVLRRFAEAFRVWFRTAALRLNRE